MSSQHLADGKLRLDEPAPHVARLTIDNPAKRNALDHAILDAIAETVRGLDARCLLITAAGPVFSAGYDIGGLPKDEFAHRAEALVAVAQALESARWDADADSIRDRLDGSVAALRDELAADRAAGQVLQAQELEEMLRRGASVRGELRGAIDLATSWQGEGPPPDPVRHTRPRRAELGLRRPGPILRANLTLRSSAFRHALRLGLTVAVAAAICNHLGWDTRRVIGHKEWALPVGRKSDPTFDMNAFRATVQAARTTTPQED